MYVRTCRTVRTEGMISRSNNNYSLIVYTVSLSTTVRNCTVLTNVTVDERTHATSSNSNYCVMIQSFLFGLVIFQ